MAYAWSPEVSLEGMKEAKLNFTHAAKFQTTLRDLCCVSVRKVESGEIVKIAIPQWPSTGAWTFTDSGEIDLSAFIGEKVQIGLYYASNSSGADTWEIRNMKLRVTPIESGVTEIGDDDDDSFLVEVWGNSIMAPEGSRIFDMNGREVNGENLQKGIYIVVKPTFRKAVKVMVR